VIARSQRSAAPGDTGVALASAPTRAGVLRRRAGAGHSASLYVGGTIAAILGLTALLSLFVHFGDPNATDLVGRRQAARHHRRPQWTVGGRRRRRSRASTGVRVRGERGRAAPPRTRHRRG
jgi:hypothetical protein